MTLRNAFSALAYFCIIAAVTMAHPHALNGGESPAIPGYLASKCSREVGEMKQRRQLFCRQFHSSRNDEETFYGIHAEAPKYNFLTNWTNILLPEATTGPFIYPQRQTMRQNIRDNQAGIPLSLEIGVIDVDTCEPLEGVLVDIWHCNATGSYSSFTRILPDIPLEDQYRNLRGGKSLDIHKGFPDLTWLSTDQETWLRGMWPTDKHGVTLFTTIFPGFYAERSIHIHVQVHTNWTVGANNTLLHGPVVSTGQLFIEEAVEQEIMTMEPYASHTTIERVKNDADGTFRMESGTGAIPTLDTEPLDGVSYANGVFGYITLGIQTKYIRNGSTVDAGKYNINLELGFLTRDG